VSDPVISVSGLRKSYGNVEAIRGVDLSVDGGEIFAFLGPNGAGKTTTVEILEGYRERSAGEVRVLGADPRESDRAWRSRIGLVLQECRMQPELTVRETVEQYAGYYSRPRCVDETIDLVGLGEKAGERAGRLSGGQQRRLDVALALIGDAELLFLDEPTTGFDPSARRQAWDVIASLRELGKTVFLTTHYMDEAQALADRVAIIARGEILASGTPETLAGRDLAPSEIRFRISPSVAVSELPPAAAAALDGTANGSYGTLVLRTSNPVAVLHELTAWALARNVELTALEVTRPSLEDVYLEVTRGQ
jgi:ABC-2 type transport system ATP-binding protein